jgi:hypothetical protein
MKVEMLLETKSCPTCGIVYAVPQDWYASLNRQHDRGDHDVKWYCPNGHVTVFSREAKYVAIERERDRLKQDNARLDEARIKAERRLLVVQKEVKSRAKRAAAGVCPCCNRTFIQLARHMKTKHPDEVALRLPSPEGAHA